MLHNNQGVGSGNQSSITSRLHTIQVDNRINDKQYKKVGHEDAKTWMERRLAKMKSGVPNWAATDLASHWCDGLKLHNLDETIAEIESINLAKSTTTGMSQDWGLSASNNQRGYSKYLGAN
jgi:hypothetical protein